MIGIGIGHHASDYLFPEFPIEGGKYKADYLLVGKGSGGHEFVFIELEAPHWRTTLKDGYYGESTRKGYNQIDDWGSAIGRDYDSSRFHFVVVSGIRDDFDDKSYEIRRKDIKRRGILWLHYDNLYEGAMDLLEKKTF